MASNISQDTIPYLWNSANDDIEYTFSFNPNLIDSITNSSGYVKVNLAYDFDVTPVVGEYIYLSTNVYVGTYKILTVTGTSSVTLDLSYISGITSNIYNCYHLRVPVIELYKTVDGVDTLIVPMKPSILYTDNIPYIYLNLKGIAKYIFTIEPNTTPSIVNEYDWNMFCQLYLVYDAITTDFIYCLNSAITTTELNYKYLNSGIYLLPIDKPLIATNGTTFVSEIIVGGVVLRKFVNGVQQ